MRFKCANRISIFLRSCRDCSKPSAPASDRTTSRACSWMSRGILYSKQAEASVYCEIRGNQIIRTSASANIYLGCGGTDKITVEMNAFKTPNSSERASG